MNITHLKDPYYKGVIDFRNYFVNNYEDLYRQYEERIISNNKSYLNIKYFIQIDILKDNITEYSNFYNKIIKFSEIYNIPLNFVQKYKPVRL